MSARKWISFRLPLTSWDRSWDRTTTDKAMIRFSSANTRYARLAWYSSST